MDINCTQSPVDLVQSLYDFVFRGVFAPCTLAGRTICNGTDPLFVEKASSKTLLLCYTDMLEALNCLKQVADKMNQKGIPAGPLSFLERPEAWLLFCRRITTLQWAEKDSDLGAQTRGSEDLPQRPILPPRLSRACLGLFGWGG